MTDQWLLWYQTPHPQERQLGILIFQLYHRESNDTSETKPGICKTVKWGEWSLFALYNYHHKSIRRDPQRQNLQVFQFTFLGSHLRRRCSNEYSSYCLIRQKQLHSKPQQVCCLVQLDFSLRKRCITQSCAVQHALSTSERNLLADLTLLFCPIL